MKKKPSSEAKYLKFMAQGKRVERSLRPDASKYAKGNRPGALVKPAKHTDRRGRGPDRGFIPGQNSFPSRFR